MRLRLAVLSVCLLVPTHVAAKPAPYRDYTFDGDKYSARVAEVARSMRRQPSAYGQRRAAKARHLYRTKPRHRTAPVPARRPGTVAPMTMGRGLMREVVHAAGLPENLGSTRPRVVGGHFIRGRLTCAANVGAELARRGIRGTGSRLAKSYLTWGRASGPVPGAVAVFGRLGGGHTAIVHSVTSSGRVIYLNPSSRRQAWVIGPYGRRPIAYRVAG